MTFDYEKLLKAYIRLVRDEESVTFLEWEERTRRKGQDPNVAIDGLTSEETGELIRVAIEAVPDGWWVR